MAWSTGKGKIVPGSRIGISGEHSNTMFLQVTSDRPAIGEGILRPNSAYAIDIVQSNGQRPAGDTSPFPRGKGGKVRALSQMDIPLYFYRVDPNTLVVLFVEPFTTPWWAKIPELGSSICRLQLSRRSSDGPVAPRYFNCHGSMRIGERKIQIRTCEAAIKLETFDADQIPKVILAYDPDLERQGWQKLPISSFTSPYVFSLEPEEANLVFDTRNDKLLPINPGSNCNWSAAFADADRLWEAYSRDLQIWIEFVNSTFGAGLGNYVVPETHGDSSEIAEVCDNDGGRSRGTARNRRTVLDGFRPYKLSFWEDPNFSFTTPGNMGGPAVLVYRIEYRLGDSVDVLWVLERFTREAALVMLTDESLLMDVLSRKCQRGELWEEHRLSDSRVAYIKIHPTDGANWSIQDHAANFLRERWSIT